MPTTHYTSKVTLYKGVPFDDSYINILSPGEISKKKTVLDNNYKHKEYTNIMLIKINTTTGVGRIRLALPPSEAETYNYAFVENNRGSNFFAFIHGCQYINDGRTTEDNVIECVYEFDITKDVVMSHFLNVRQFIPAPIIRHTSTEHFKNAKAPETFPATGLINYSYVGCTSQIPRGNEYKCVVIYIDKNNYLSADINHVPTGCQIRAFNNSLDASVYMKDSLVSDNAQILTIYNVPAFMLNVDNVLPTSGIELTDSNIVKSMDLGFLQMNYYTTEGHLDFEYIPANNKCYYYPFNMVRVYSNDGSYYDCAFEDFLPSTGGYAEFKMEISSLPPVYYAVKPKNYRNSPDNPLGFKIKTSTWPVGSYSQDSYGQYLANRFNDASNGFRLAAQVGTELAIAAIPTTVSGLSHLPTGYDHGAEDVEKEKKKYEASLGAGLASTAVSAGLSMFNYAQAEMTSQYAALRATDSFGGTVNTGDSDLANNNLEITFSHVALRPELMKSLDDYFTNYGYAQGGVLDIPDWTGRDSYVYVRTGGNVFQPFDVPGELTHKGNECPNVNETSIINNVFLRGTTVWNINHFDGSIVKGGNGADPIALPGISTT